MSAQLAALALSGAETVTRAKSRAAGSKSTKDFIGLDGKDLAQETDNNVA